MFLRSMYHNTFIDKTPEGKDTSPMDVVLVNNTVDLPELGPTATLISEYRKLSIMERYGLSLTEWWNLDMGVHELINMDSRRETKAQAAKAKEVENRAKAEAEAQEREILRQKK